MNVNPAVAGANYGGYVSTDIVLPDARKAGLTGPEGQGASVEVSLSPQAAAMLTIDMDSLAAKGYSEVDIDTDGKPGAEISIKVQPGAGTVMVGAQGVAGSDAASGLGASDQSAEDILLQILLKSDSDEDSQDKQAEHPDGANLLLQIALRAYNAHAASPTDKSTTDTADPSTTG